MKNARLTGLVLPPGPNGRCDDLRVGGAVVERLPDRTWRMIYYCRDRAYPRAAPVTLGTGRLALATSRDGIAWTRVDGLAAKGALLDAGPGFDSGHVGVTDLSRDGDTWTLWTFGGQPDEITRTGLPHLGDVPGLAMRCGRVVSEDGLHWRRVPGQGTAGALFDILPDEIYAAWPNIVADERGVLLHYTAPDHAMHTFRTRIVRLDALGGVTRVGDLRWLESAATHDVGGIVTRHVIADPFGQARWLMAYTALDAQHRRTIALARSDDGVTWRHSGGPVLRAASAGHWDDCGVAINRLVVTEDTLHLYYYGFRSLTAPETQRGIGLAIAPRVEPLVFTRVGDASDRERGTDRSHKERAAS